MCSDEDVTLLTAAMPHRAHGEAAIARGARGGDVAGRPGSAAAGRNGAGVIKALNPSCNSPGSTAAFWKFTWPKARKTAGAIWRRHPAYHLHQFPHPCGRSRAYLAAPGASRRGWTRLSVARALRRAAPDPHGARSALPVGRNAAGNAGRATAESARGHSRAR